MWKKNKSHSEVFVKKNCIHLPRTGIMSVLCTPVSSLHTQRPTQSIVNNTEKKAKGKSERWADDLFFN